MTIVLFTVSFSNLHYNKIQREWGAISGRNYTISRNCLASTLNLIVMKIRIVNREKDVLHWIMAYFLKPRTVSIFYKELNYKYCSLWMIRPTLFKTLQKTSIISFQYNSRSWEITVERNRFFIIHSPSVS